MFTNTENNTNSDKHIKTNFIIQNTPRRHKTIASNPKKNIYCFENKIRKQNQQNVFLI